MPIRLVDSNEDRMKEDVSQNKKQNPDQSQDEKNLTKAITAQIDAEINIQNIFIKMATKHEHQFVGSDDSDRDEKGEKKAFVGKLGIGEMFATKVAMAALKKSCRGTKAQL